MNVEEVHKGTKLMIDGIPYNVDNFEFMKPGKGRAVYRFRVRNLYTGMTLEKTYHSGDSVDEISITGRDMQYLYKEGDDYVFMDSESFEQFTVSTEKMGDRYKWLQEGMTVNMQMMGDVVLDINLPNFMELEVIETGIAVKGATVTQQTKPATLSTGAVIEVPPFIKQGDILKVDTRTSTYVERVNNK